MSQFKLKVPQPNLMLIVGLIVTVWILLGWFYFMASTPVNEDTRTRIIKIKPGMTLKQVSVLLKNENLIKNSAVFKVIAFLQNKQNQIMVGEYEISSSMVPLDILRRVTSGKTVLHPVTIPEGYRITEIAGILESNGLVEKEEFIRLTQDKEVLKFWDIPGKSLEGYLFPETYHFSKFTDARKIIDTMMKTFQDQVSPLNLDKRAEAMKFTPHKVITLASIIEKETGKAEERPLIASVFHNRLKKNMLLQTDPTVIYAIKNFDGNIRKKDLSIDSPYNTYKYRGLPPGPIASPGLKAIIAVLEPDDSDYLYFVSRQDGSHQFSATLEAHNNAVRKYQLRKVRRSR
jgi:UPF0755 protein